MVDDEMTLLEEWGIILEGWGLTLGKSWPYLLLLSIIIVFIIIGFILISALQTYGEGMASFQG